MKSKPEMDVFLSTCPRDCYDACGLRVRVADGEIIQVAGDRNHPRSRGKLCEKCSIGYNSVWLDSKSRVTQPLRRTGNKGEGQFERISWQAAVCEIAENWQRIVQDHGPESILNTHYSGTIASIGFNFPMRFFNRLGATEVDPDSICNLAGHIALDYLYGSSVTGFDPRTAKDSNCIMVWGANPAHAGPHTFKHWLCDQSAELIVVDPIRTDTAKAADLHLQLRPGTDAALAYTLMHVMWSKSIIDPNFIATYCVGWQQLEAVIKDCTLKWGEQQTGVPAKDIEAAALHYAAGPSLLWLGQGFQRQPMGGNAMRAAACLPAITANIARPGTGFLYMNGSGASGIDDDYLTGPHLRREQQSRISHMDLAKYLENPARSKALICWNVNNAASSPQQHRLTRALAREDLFTVVADVFLTDTTDYADIVLPAASFLESDDVFASYFDLTVSAQAKIVEPMGESQPNSEIFRRLAKAMEYGEPELYESDIEIIDTLLDRSHVDETFASLKRKGTVEVSPQPIMQFENLTFPTPSGKIELASARAQTDGLPLVPTPHADMPPADRYLRLLSPAPNWTTNTTFGNSTKIDRQQGRPTITLHPEDATKRGIVDGDRVLVSNHTGSLTLALAVSSEVPKGVALSHKGRWLKRGQQRVNINVLNPGQKADMGDSSAVHGIEVLVERSGDRGQCKNYSPA